MREVEAKYQVDDAETVAVLLKAVGVELGDPATQDDQAYAQVGWRFGDDKRGAKFARLRTIDGRRHVMTVKVVQDNAMVCREAETGVSDRGQAHEVLCELGMYPTVRIVKTRRTGVLGEVTVCLDEVESVGTFLEVELLVDDDRSGPQVQEELDGLVSSWGIGGRRVTQTYDSLVRTATT